MVIMSDLQSEHTVSTTVLSTQKNRSIVYSFIHFLSYEAFSVLKPRILLGVSRYLARPYDFSGN